MTLSCVVIEDLLPAYCDGSCTPESRAAVEEHLADCPRCRRFYTALHRPLPLEEPRKNPPPLRSVEKRWKKWTKGEKKEGGRLCKRTYPEKSIKGKKGRLVSRGNFGPVCGGRRLSSDGRSTVQGIHPPIPGRHCDQSSGAALRWLHQCGPLGG